MHAILPEAYHSERSECRPHEPAPQAAPEQDLQTASPRAPLRMGQPRQSPRAHPHTPQEQVVDVLSNNTRDRPLAIGLEEVYHTILCPYLCSFSSPLILWRMLFARVAARTARLH